MTASVTLCWLIALVVLFSVRSLLSADVRWWLWTCVTGLAMGLFGLWYVPFLKRRRARSAAERAALAEPQAADGQFAPGYVSRDSGSNTVSSTDTPGKSTRS